MIKQLFLLGLGAFLSLCCYSCNVEKLALAGSGWQEIVIVDKKSGLIEWKHALDEGDECNDIEVTPKGEILYAYSKGARLIDRNHQTVWDYKAKENEEIHTATRLKDGGYMLAVCGQPARIVELDKDGKQVKEIAFQTATFDTHKQFRQVMKTDSDIYLVPLMEKRKIIQLTPAGGNKGSIFIGADVFSVKLLKNNNLLVSCGKDGKIVEVDRNIDLSQQLFPNDKIETDHIKGGVLLYVAEIFLYENGNKLIANSNMYSSDKSQPLLVEVNADNEVVWSLPYNKEIKNVTAVYSFFK